MKTPKLSPRAKLFLRAVVHRTREGLIWIPGDKWQDEKVKDGLQPDVIQTVGGSGDAVILRSLASKELIRFERGYESQYWCRSTAEGEALIDSWLAKGSA